MSKEKVFGKCRRFWFSSGTGQWHGMLDGDLCSAGNFLFKSCWLRDGARLANRCTVPLRTAQLAAVGTTIHFVFVGRQVKFIVSRNSRFSFVFVEFINRRLDKIIDWRIPIAHKAIRLRSDNSTCLNLVHYPIKVTAADEIYIRWQEKNSFSEVNKSQQQEEAARDLLLSLW